MIIKTHTPCSSCRKYYTSSQNFLQKSCLHHESNATQYNASTVTNRPLSSVCDTHGSYYSFNGASQNSRTPSPIYAGFLDSLPHTSNLPTYKPCQHRRTQKSFSQIHATTRNILTPIRLHYCAHRPTGCRSCQRRGRRATHK